MAMFEELSYTQQVLKLESKKQGNAIDTKFTQHPLRCKGTNLQRAPSTSKEQHGEQAQIHLSGILGLLPTKGDQKARRPSGTEATYHQGKHQPEELSSLRKGSVNTSKRERGICNTSPTGVTVTSQNQMYFNIYLQCIY
ncbi:hypothetical protein Anapl_10559 [Anas platyrhynchos]|uniref:Uncharacterized protein n=1 Tax=Anas platyrhynchos TaxID=8839 RepID=R0JJS7_ANAPL|nr:hypothetical protein Anapl_10559 [Anas platyrhynchos]